MPTLDPKTTALILIDLQKGIVPMAGGPIDGATLLANCTNLAARFREAGAPVVQVHVGFKPDEMPSQLVDEPSLPATGTPPEFSVFADGVVEPTDIVVLKHHWGAFTGTDLDLQLRRRGVKTVVIGGIATNMGVESTARSAWELSYNVVIAADAVAGRSTELHEFAMTNIFPKIARVTGAEGIDFDIG